jgi:hypothetical protein
MKEEEMFKEVLEYYGKQTLPKVKEIKLRKMIRKDVKQVIKKERESLDYSDTSSDSCYESDDQDWEQNIENKVMYGSDSD